MSTDTNGARRKLSGFKTDLVTDGALEFLEQAKNGPFYPLVPFYAPHTPYDFQPDAYRKPHLESKLSCFPDEPLHGWQNPGLATHHGNRASKLSYSALISGVDANVGRVLRKLEEIGARDNAGRFHRRPRLERGPSWRVGQKGTGRGRSICTKNRFASR